MSWSCSRRSPLYVAAIVSKVSIPLGLSSASIVATEGPISASSSSSRALSAIFPSLTVSSPAARLNRVTDATAGPGVSDKRSSGRARPAIGCVEVDDIAKQHLSLVELVPPDDNGLESQRALAQPRDHRLAPSLDALGDRDLALARKQFLRTHVAEIDAHRVVGARRGILGHGFGRNTPSLDFD